jgi:hypothetical protein
MGKDWPDYIIEAKRCLAKNGLLFIVETTNSLSARLSDLRKVITDQGFEIYLDEERGAFTFIDSTLAAVYVYLSEYVISMIK